MKTVGEFKKAGLQFVKDDCGDNFLVKNPVSFNGYGASFENDLVRFFSWRENTGVKPEFSGAIDVITESWDSGDCHSKTHYASTLNWSNHCLNKVIKWRPSLNHPSAAKPDTKQSAEEKRMDIIGQNGNDGLHYDNTAQQVEALAANHTLLQPRNSEPIFRTNEDTQKSLNEHLAKLAESKPIFTQAKADNGELPPVGSLFIDIEYNENKQVLALAHHLGKVVYAADYDDVSQVDYFHADQDCCMALDTRTDREKAIDEMLKDSRCNGSVIEICIERLYDAGYRKC